MADITIDGNSVSNGQVVSSPHEITVSSTGKEKFHLHIADPASVDNDDQDGGPGNPQSYTFNGSNTYTVSVNKAMEQRSDGDNHHRHVAGSGSIVVTTSG